MKMRFTWIVLVLWSLAFAAAAESPAPLTDAEGRVPVIVVLRSSVKIKAAEPVAKSVREGTPDPLFRDVLAKELEARRDYLTQTRKRLAGSGLIQGRKNLAANALVGWCDPDRIETLLNDPDVAEVIVDQELKPMMNITVPTLLPDAYHNAGWYGQASAFDPAILDAGIDASHPAFDGITFYYHVDHSLAVSNSLYNDSSSNPDDLTNNGHGTHIAGIIAGRGSATWENYVGVAPGTEVIYNLKSGYYKTNGDVGLYFTDALDNIDWGLFESVNDDIDLLNFSWGVTATADDSGLARFFDALVDDLNVPVCLPAGNEGPYIAITDPGIAYNGITLGATNDAGTFSRLDDNVTGNSSRGPTLGGRKKPDLVAPGYLIHSPTNAWESGFDYLGISGTSFAAPHALGAVQLIMDEMGPPADPIAVKALLIASASPGSFYESGASLEWDAKWGWGYINLERAFDYKNNVYRKSLAPAGSSGDFHLYRGPMEAVQRAALVWNRHVNYVSGGGQPSSAYGLNDLNMRLYDHTNNNQLDASTSGIDNVEVVTVSLSDYDAVIKVYSVDSSFNGVSYESYGLSTPPGWTFPSSLPQPRARLYRIDGDPQTVVAYLYNPGGFNAHNVEVDLDLPSGMSFAGGLSVSEAGSVLRNPGTAQHVLIWKLSGNSTGSLDLGLSSVSYGETFTHSTSLSLDTQPAGLEVSLTPDTLSAAQGTTVTLSAEVSNSSPSSLSFAELTLITEDGVVLTTGTLVQTVDGFAAGETRTVEWDTRMPEQEGVAHFVVLAEAMTAGGSELNASALASVGIEVAQPESLLSVRPYQLSDRYETGQYVEMTAECANLGVQGLDEVFVELAVPDGWILLSGSYRQGVGAFSAGQVVQAGRWLLRAPTEAGADEFTLTIDDAGTGLAQNSFTVYVGQDPPTPPYFTALLQDAPQLQNKHANTDNDPVGLCVLPSGEFVFFNSQSGIDALYAFNPAYQGNAGLRLLASEDSLQEVVGTKEALSVDSICCDPQGNIYVLVRVIRDSGNDPLALVMVPSTGNGGHDAARLILPPGLPPVGLLFNDNTELGSLAWDGVGQRLLVLVDGESDNDDDDNGVYQVNLQTNRLELLYSYAELGAALTPPATPGADAIGFTAMTVGLAGEIYLYHGLGSGNNDGDLLRIDPNGDISLFVESDLLANTLATDHADFNVRIEANRLSGKLGVLVTDSASDTTASDGLFAEYDPATGKFGKTRPRMQLLDATEATALVNYGHALTSDDDGTYYLWSALDNESLIAVPSRALAPNAVDDYDHYQ